MRERKQPKILLQMMRLVKSLDKTIVCEGVETAMNVALLERSECDVMQGYYYCHPIPMRNFVY